MRSFTHVLLMAGVGTAGASAPHPVGAQTPNPPTVLVVVAHPDDDAMFSASIYRITHTLGGKVDLAVVTDGSGGFRFSQLAEPIYGLELSDEAVAREYLPAIRKRELLDGGAIVGIRRYFLLDEYDHAYTENVDTVLTHVWDAERVRQRLTEIMTDGAYEFVFVHLPIPNFHAHHKAASILALEAARATPADRRPIVLGSFVGEGDGDTSLADFEELPGYPITRVRHDGPHFLFDRRQPIDPEGRLDYRIVVNWVIAAHKSQGTMQLLVNRGDVERFWMFEMNDAGRFAEAEGLFEELGTSGAARSAQ